MFDRRHFLLTAAAASAAALTPSALLAANPLSGPWALQGWGTAAMKDIVDGLVPEARVAALRLEPRPYMGRMHNPRWLARALAVRDRYEVPRAASWSYGYMARVFELLRRLEADGRLVLTPLASPAGPPPAWTLGTDPATWRVVALPRADAARDALRRRIGLAALAKA